MVGIRHSYGQFVMEDFRGFEKRNAMFQRIRLSLLQIPFKVQHPFAPLVAPRIQTDCGRSQERPEWAYIPFACRKSDRMQVGAGIVLLDSAPG